MSDFPDILGMELHDATALLEAEGLPFIIIETKPVKRKNCIPAEAGQFPYDAFQTSAPRLWIGAQKEPAEGVSRVIRVKQEKSFVLTVCRI